ncbi:carotenoid oxygenase family protein [Streptomyces sp. NBC_00631]|uniref:carotenoid oxygenase family protein n=1 Tax=Streptomyces sp. NBC_00631 TaxID=2975793 RepID=UPI00386D53B5
MFLNGPFAPWRQEGVAFDLEIEGALTDELSGALFQTSASPYYRPIEPDRHHWFDSDGMVCGVHLRDGSASSRKRHVAGHSRAEAGDEGRPGPLGTVDERRLQPSGHAIRPPALQGWRSRHPGDRKRTVRLEVSAHRRPGDAR